jgi:DNA-binding transcriptional MerR regulator
MRIGELAKAAQIPEKTIRYYESRDLIAPALREDNGYRRYGQSDLDKLIFIRRCRELGISLQDIKVLVKVQGDRGAGCASVDTIIDRQLDKVRHTLVELQALEKTLSGLRVCDGETVGECQILKRLVG